MVEEVREGATMGESRARSVKRVRPEGQTSDRVEVVDVDRVMISPSELKLQDIDMLDRKYSQVRGPKRKALPIGRFLMRILSYRVSIKVYHPQPLSYSNSQIAIEFSPSAATPSTLPRNLTSEAAPSTKSPRVESQPTIKAKQKAARSESENPQDKGQLGQQGTRMPGNDPPRANKEEAADKTQGGRMMQVNRRGSASRKKRETYVHSIPEL